MLVKDILERLGFELVAGEAGIGKDVTEAYCCDLLSFAMGTAPEGGAWVTIMGNVNVIAVASLADIACVVLAQNVVADDAMIAKANEQGIPVLRAPDGIFPTAKAIDALL